MNGLTRLEEIARIVRSGHAFFVYAYAQQTQAQMRSTFTYCIEVKSQFLVDIAPWVSAPTDACSSDSCVIAIERIYADARDKMSASELASSASQLGFAEAQLLRRSEKAYEQTQDWKLKRVLKTYYPQFVICREAMWRWGTQRAA